GHSIRDRGRRRGRAEDPDRSLVACLSGILLRDDPAPLFNSHRDAGRIRVCTLAGSVEMAFPATRLRFLFFVHPSAGYFVFDRRKRKTSARPQCFSLRTNLRCRVLEHGTAPHHDCGAVGPASVAPKVFHQDFRCECWRFPDWLRPGGFVELHSFVSKLAFCLFPKTGGWLICGAIWFICMARKLYWWSVEVF